MSVNQANQQSLCRATSSLIISLWRRNLQKSSVSPPMLHLQHHLLYTCLTSLWTSYKKEVCVCLCVYRHFTFLTWKRRNKVKCHGEWLLSWKIIYPSAELLGIANRLYMSVVALLLSLYVLIASLRYPETLKPPNFLFDTTLPMKKLYWFSCLWD